MSKKRIINRHHIVYGKDQHGEEEWVVPLFKGEHLVLSRLCWYTRKSVSLGLIRSLEYFILRNKDRAIDLDSLADSEKE